MLPFKLLSFLWVVTVILPCKASDSLRNPIPYCTIEIIQFKANNYQRDSANNLPVFHKISIDSSIKIFTANLQLAGPIKVLPAQQKLFKKWASEISSKASKPGFPIVFRSISTTAKFFNEGDLGKLRNQNASFWKKAGRGELMIGSAELLGMGILMM